MIPDRQQRRAAVTANGHAFVWASAGTGKTHTLTLRALYLLLTAPFDPRAPSTDCADLYTARQRVDRLRAARAVTRRFVLTTFTRKAAAEMQTRLYEYLDLLASAADPEALRVAVRELHPEHGDDQYLEVVDHVLGQAGDFAALRAGAEALAELATELPVCTLHSFAAALLRRHPIAAGIPPTARFAEEDEATAPDVAGLLIERWWQHVLADDRLRADLAELTQTLSLAQMTKWLGTVVEHPWIAEEMQFGEPDDDLVARIILACEALASDPKAGKLKDLQELQELLLAEPRSWEAFCNLVYEKRSRLFLDRLPAKGAVNLKAAIQALPADQQEFFASYDRIYLPLLVKCLSEEHAATWTRWQGFVGAFAAWAEDATVQKLGIVTFDEMVRLAARVVGTDDAVRREERERLWAILVDEFQDTDPVQLELLEGLLRRDAAKDHRVTGFFVGDHKQSIYRFRGADLPAIVSFVNRYAQIVIANKDQVDEFQLTASFRSRRAITDFVNTFFQAEVTLPDYEDEQLEPVRKQTGLAPEWRLLQPHPQAVTAANQREFAAWETARLIRQYHVDAGGVDSAYSEIVVLVRTHTEMNALLPVLEQAGIPVVSSGAQTFYRQPEVLDALNLLIALHNPHDPLAVGALLRSPLFGLSDPQIHQLLGDLGPAHLFHGDQALPSSLAEPARLRVEQLRVLARDRHQQSLAEWLRRVRAFVPAGVYARQDPEGRAVARIDNVLTAYRDLCERGTIAPFAWLLEQRARADRSDDFDADLGEDVSVTDESMAAVRAMTVHKAKGLQGTFVIVYGWQTTLDKRQAKAMREKKPLQLTNAEGRRVRGYQLDWGPLTIVSPAYPEADQLNQLLEGEEAKRLAYVAATRARDRLVLLSPHDKEVKGGLLAETKPAFDAGASAVPALNGTLQVALVESARGQATTRAGGLEIGDPDAYRQTWTDRAAALAQAPAPLLRRPSQPEQDAETDAVEEADYTGSGGAVSRDLALQAGTLAHRYLERHLTEARFDQDQLRALAGETIDPAAWRKATDGLRGFFGSDRHRRAVAATILGREIPVYLVVDGTSWAGVIDLVLEEGDQVIGVDYKLMTQPSMLPAEYRQQQRIYTEALARLFPGRDVGFEFWWLPGERRTIAKSAGC